MITFHLYLSIVLSFFLIFFYLFFESFFFYSLFSRTEAVNQSWDNMFGCILKNVVDTALNLPI